VVGDAGVSLPARDPGAWAEAIMRLAADEEAREALSAAGRARAALFDWRRAATMTEAVYREALGD
jgi:alpha-1,3-rhamnosyl/mannosyltransferase